MKTALNTALNSPPLNSSPFVAVDYAEHPAFRNLQHVNNGDDETVQDALRDIDAGLQELRSAAWTAPKKTERAFHGLTDRNFALLREISTERLGQRPQALECVQEALDATQRLLLNQTLYHNGGLRYESAGPASPPARTITEDLEAQGLALRHMPHEAIHAIRECLEAERRQLEAAALAGNRGHCALSLRMEGPFWQNIETQLRALGVFRGASDYNRHTMEPLNCCIVHSHQGEAWWRNCYEDVGLPTAKTVYMHQDEDHDINKILIYLSDVGPADGPFSTLRGSHGWKRSASQLALFKMLDRKFAESLAGQNTPGDVYYRRRFRTPQHREDFLAMPKPFQGTSHFGDDVMDDSPHSKQLLAAETKVLSEEANVMVFTGSTGIHRGGCVNGGSRWALQIAMKQSPPQPPFARRVAGAVRSRAGRSIRRIMPRRES